MASFSLQEAKHGGDKDKAEHDKKKKAVLKWVLPSRNIISIPVFVVHLSGFVCKTDFLGYWSNWTSLGSRKQTSMRIR